MNIIITNRDDHDFQLLCQKDHWRDLSRQHTFLGISELQIEFRVEYDSDSIFMHHITLQRELFRIFDFHWFLADQWDFEGQGLHI